MNTQTTCSDYAVRETRSPVRGAVSAIQGGVRRVMASMMARYVERETVRELSRLPSYILRDIGMQRDDIQRVAADLARERADAWSRRAEASNGFGG